MIDLNREIPRIQSALANHLFKQYGEKLEAMELLHVVQRPYSVVAFLQLRISNDVRRLVMKSTVHHPINKDITRRENQAVVEYNILRTIYPKFQEVQKCSVPRPVLVFPEIETYLMEFVEGRSLGDELRYTRYLSSPRKFSVLREHFFHCGRWLKHFQEFTGVSPTGPEALNGILERCDHRLRLIEKSSDPRCPKNLRAKVTRLLDKQLRELSGREILVCGRHGDFGPWNIIANRDGISVLDFLGYQRDPVPVDLLKMVIHLEDEKKCYTSSAKRVDALRKSFLEGFGKLPSIPVQILIICEAMHRTVSLAGNIFNLKQRFHNQFEANVRIRAHIEWLTNEGRKRVLWPS